MGEQHIKVNALIDLLNNHDTDTLDRLKANNIAYAEVIKPGISLGSDRSPGEEKPEASKLKNAVYLEIAIEGLNVAQQQMHPILDKLKSRLNKAKNLRIFGQIVAGVSSAGLITSVLSEWDKMATIATALSNVLGMVFTLFGEKLLTPSYGGKRDLVTEFEGLTSIKVRAEFLLRELKRFKELDYSEEEIVARIKEANKLASDLREAAIKAG